MRKNRYIYKIFVGDDLTPFYVGVGKEITATNRGRRERDHIHEARRGSWTSNEPKNVFILDCIERGLAFRYEYERGLTIDEAHAREIELIASYGRRDLGTGCLFNACRGGWGSKDWAPSSIAKVRALRHTEDTKKRISASHVGMKQPDEARAKIKAARAKQVMSYGESHPKFGTGSQSPRAIKLAEATRRYRARKRGEDIPLISTKGISRGPITSPKNLERIRTMNIGRVRTPAMRARMSAAAKARKRLKARNDAVGT